MSNKNVYYKFREPNEITPYEYGVLEQNIYALILCRLSILVWIEKKKGITPPQNREMNFPIDELLSRFNCSESNLKNNVSRASKSMIDKYVAYSNGRTTDKFKLLESSEYHSNSGLHIKITHRALGIIKEGIPRNYSEIDANHYFSLNGKYSRRVLKIISQWKLTKNKVLVLDIDNYREILGIPDDKYLRMESFIRNCVVSPIRDVINSSNGQWEASDKDQKGFILYRQGRSFKKIQLMMQYKSEEDTDLPF